MIKTIARRTRTNRVFYAKNVHMGISFDGLAEIALKQLGGEIKLGDMIVADSTDQKKRKAMQWTEKGFMIYYGKITKGILKPLARGSR